MEWIEARPIIALRLGITEEALGLIMDEVFEEVEPDDEVRITIQDEDFSLSIDGASYKRFNRASAELEGGSFHTIGKAFPPHGDTSTDDRKRSKR